MCDLLCVQPKSFMTRLYGIVSNLQWKDSMPSVTNFFGRCLAFFRDAIGDHYIAIRWFEACNGDRNVIDPIVQMPRVQEACITATTSYGVMPVTALLNGALLIPNGDLFYALQSPREQDVYITRNS
jgi:hypothetical protein